MSGPENESTGNLPPAVAGAALAEEANEDTYKYPGLSGESMKEMAANAELELSAVDDEDYGSYDSDLPGAVSIDETEGKVMSVIDHLDELRLRLIRSLAVFALAMALTFSFGKEIIKFLELPAGNMTFQALSIEEPLFVYCKVAFYGALILAAPYLLFEISGFVSPGLKKKERVVLMPIVIGGPLLFVAGAAFCYTCVLPPMVTFFTSFGVGISPVQQRLDFYISLVTTMLFYMGICFQLPIVLFALSLAGLVNSKQLLGFWRYAITGAAVAAAIITPDPTVVSMVIVMVALCGLYFFTVLLLKLFGR